MTVRLKEIGGPTYNTYTWVQIPKSTGIPQYFNLANQLDSITRYEHRGVSIPNFFARQKRGELLPYTNWVQFKSEGKASGGANLESTNFLYQYPQRIATPSWCIQSGDVQSAYVSDRITGSLDQYTAIAAAKLVSKGWDALTFAAELHKAIRMFRGLLGRFITLLQSGRAQDLWLEGRYGWRLMLYDMNDIIDIINGCGNDRKRFTERAGYTENFTNTWVESTTVGISTFDIRFSDRVTLGVRGSVGADITPPRYYLDPINTAWELIPWSFVVDWIIGVGSWLQSLSFLILSSDHTACYGYSCKVVRTTELLPETCTFQSGYSGTWWFTGTCESEHTIRVPTSIPRLPRLQTKIDGFKLNDLMYLMFSLLRRR